MQASFFFFFPLLSKCKFKFVILFRAMAPFPLEKALILGTITVHQYNVKERTELSKATFLSHRREPELNILNARRVVYLSN